MRVLVREYCGSCNRIVLTATAADSDPSFSLAQNSALLRFQWAVQDWMAHLLRWPVHCLLPST